MLTYILMLIPIISASSPFWLTAEVQNIEWMEGCLTTALCAQPRFQVVKDLMPISERVSINWPISERFSADSSKQFVSYWPSGRVEDISIAAQVTGTDRTYGFPRVCDQTPSVRVFPEIDEAFEQDVNNRTFHVKGKCFDAVIHVSKHTERCPWCPDPADMIIGNEIQMPSEASALESSINSLVGFLYTPSSSTESLQIVIIVLAGFAVLASTAFSLVLVLFLKSKRSNVHINVKPKLIPYIEESRYELPWDQMNRPLTKWISPSTCSGRSSEGYNSFRIPPPPSFSPYQSPPV
ncbi:unnamed protein product [Caenorhabditis bovis]|uniref:C2 domain-containing protein n=1 Tax=Caenorhabditis bovis TaxID=2654633 RepID=A0A8S1EQ22_9PELO|nr:unnamed protein product [Caenorhabditis bovis]